MTTLHPTPSGRRGFRGVPYWVAVVAACLVAVVLIGVGLLLTNGNDDQKVSATPTCTPSPPAPSATRPPTKAVTLNVYNSTDRAGLARDTADALGNRGFTVEEVANDPKKATIAGSAVVRYVKGSGTQARWVAAQVPGATIAAVSGKGRPSAVKVDLVLGQGYQALAADPAAKAAFAASAPRRGC